jgi:tetratricopeptide (TPR) repeat protein
MEGKIGKFLFLILIVWFFSGWLAAEDQQILILKEEKETPPSPDSAQAMENVEQSNTSGASFSIFYERWKGFEMAYAEHNKDGQDQLLHEMLTWKSYHSIPSLPQFAASLVAMGDTEAHYGRKDDAMRFYQAAVQFDPSFSPAYYQQARLYLSRGLKSLIPAANATIQGILAPRTTLAGKLQWYSKYLLLLLTSVVISAFVFSLILLIKYFTLLRHDLEERFSPRFRPSIVEIALWIVLFLPVFFLFGPLWLAPFWIMVFWPYSRIPEKMFSLLFLAAFILAFPAYQKAGQLARAYRDSSTAAYVTAFTDGASPKSISDLQAYVAQNPRDADASITLAYLYKTDHQASTAIELLQKHIVSNPSDARAYNNLGNIYFIQGETDSGLRLIQRAADQEPQNVIYCYNLSKLQRAKFNFQEAERLMEDARRLDPILVENLEGSPQEKLVDAIPSADLVWQRIKQQNGASAKLLRNPFTLTGIVFFVLTFIFSFTRSTIAHDCTKCGKPFCDKCQSSARHYSYCTQCLHIFVKKDGVSPISRKEKMKEIERHSRRQSFYTRLSSLVIPGSGSLFENRTFFGIFILLLWFFFLSFLFFLGKLNFLSYFDPPEAFGVIAPFCIFLLAILYFAANTSFLKRSRA